MSSASLHIPSSLLCPNQNSIIIPLPPASQHPSPVPDPPSCLGMTEGLSQ